MRGALLLVLTLFVGPALADAGTDRTYYLNGSGEDATAEPSSRPPAFGTFHQRGANPYVAVVPIAETLWIQKASGFALHLDDHRAYFDGNYSTRITVFLEGEPEMAIADATFRVTLEGDATSAPGEMEGWSVYHLDARPVPGIAERADAVLIPAGSHLVLRMELEGPTTQAPLSFAKLWRDHVVGPVAAATPETLIVGSPAEGAVDAADALGKNAPRYPPGGYKPLIEAAYGGAEASVDQFDRDEGTPGWSLDQLARAPLPAASFAYGNDAKSRVVLHVVN